MLFRNKLLFSLLFAFGILSPVIGKSPIVLPIPFEDVTSKNLTKMLDISANYVHVDDTSGTLVISGNAEIKFQDIELHTDYLEYHYNSQNLYCPGWMVLDTEQYLLSIHGFHYDMKSYKGGAKKIQGNIDRFLVRGEDIKLAPEKTSISNVNFTTCDLNDEHYAIKSGRIDLFPIFGFFVAQRNRIHLRGVKGGLWIPTIFYGSLNNSLLGVNAFPEIGSTLREGFYLKYSLPNYQNSRSNGSYDFGYMANLGPYLGFSHLYRLAPEHQLVLKAHTIGSDGYSGKILYQADLSQLYNYTKRQPVSSTLLSPLNSFQIQPKGIFRLDTTWGELLTNSRVSFVPRVRVDLNDYHLWQDKLFFSGRAETAHIHENTIDDVDTVLWRTIGKAKVERRYHPTDHIEVIGGIDYLNYFYHTQPNWNRSFATGKIRYSKDRLFHELYYSEKLAVEGNSPFEFDRLFEQDSDELGLTLSLKAGDSVLSFVGAWKTDQDWESRILSISSSVAVHRVSILVGLDFKQSTIFFGGTL